MGMSTSPNTRFSPLSILTEHGTLLPVALSSALKGHSICTVRKGAFSLIHFCLWHPNEPQHTAHVATTKRGVHEYTHPDQHNLEVNAAEVQTGETQPERDRPTLQLCAQDWHQVLQPALMR